MLTRLLLAVILAFVGAQCASAGVLVRAEQTPEAVGVMSMSVDDDVPLGAPAFEKGDASFGMTVTSSFSSTSMVAFSECCALLVCNAPVAEIIRVQSALLPTCPFLEVKLKPA